MDKSAAEKIAVASVACEVATGFPAELSAAQCALESGWLAHAPGNNPFGIKERKGRKRQLLITTEWFNDAQLAAFMAKGSGRWAKPTGQSTGMKKQYRVADFFAAYNSLDEAMADHAALLMNPSGPYARAWSAYLQSQNVRTLARDISPIYATDPSYSKTLAALIDAVTPWVAAARSAHNRNIISEVR
jgi:flagellum-specific peptidoglycan hydrolase FlgJ